MSLLEILARIEDLPTWKGLAEMIRDARKLGASMLTKKTVWVNGSGVEKTN